MKHYLLLSTFLAAALTMAAAPDTPVSIKASNRKAETVFKELMRQSGTNFIYNSGLLKGRRVTVNATRRPLEEVLRQMFPAGCGITYEFKGNSVLLKSEPNVRKTVKQTKRVMIHGYVDEAATGEHIIGATVRDNVSGLSTQTNSSGYFSLPVPAGTKASVSAFFPGYASPSSIDVSPRADTRLNITLEPAKDLEEVIVTTTRNRLLNIESPAIGAVNIGRETIKATPVIFGESDVIKTLQLEPGVSAGIEGMAGMNVHGGNPDENLYMLDNVPLYQVNHLGGLFSAFNTEAIKNVDFYKSSFPARLDGRLSSFIDVNTRDGSYDGHHGSFRLGLTSGAFDISGPIWKGHTTYSFAVRRSWLDLLTVPACAILNKTLASDDEKYHFGYAFTDVNAKINHRFNDRTSAHATFYWGDDYIKVESEWPGEVWSSNDKVNMRWGNILATAGADHAFSSSVFGHLTFSYSRYASRLSHLDEEIYYENKTSDRLTSRNNIHDFRLAADMQWKPSRGGELVAGLSATHHSYLPSRSLREIVLGDEEAELLLDSTPVYHSVELNAYAEYNRRFSSRFSLSAGVHGSLFNIREKTHTVISPRLSVSYNPSDGWAVKAAYARTGQFVHQLMQSCISLPTDQWVPITGNLKPQTADKISAGVYYANGAWSASVEGYWKWMHNIIDYRDEYYLLPPAETFGAGLTSGSGRARGIDFKLARESGHITGHISYSLLWSDRLFADKNGGQRFPSRFDNRHKINILATWNINSKWSVSASWTGMSGNRFTLPTQCWQGMPIDGHYTWFDYRYDMSVSVPVNNMRLPFYHRLDVSATRRTRRGEWTFSLYNAYCHMNTIAYRQAYAQRINPSPGNYELYDRPVFQKVKLIPIIPSVSYTWIF